MVAGAGYKLTDALDKKWRRTFKKGLGTVAGALVGLGIAVAGALLHFLMFGMAVSVTIGPGATTFAILCCALFGSLAGWILGSHAARTDLI